MADKKKIKKQDKEEKYKKLLQAIDIKLGEEKVDEKQKKVEDLIASQKKNQQEQQKPEEVLTISGLLSKIQGNDEQENAQNLKKQLEDLEKRSKLLHEPESFVKQERAERKINYKIVQDDVAKWIPIIKRAREADHLDFTQKTQDNLRINAISGDELKRNKIAMSIEQKLQQLNLKTEKQIKAKEIELLEKLDPQEAKRRINEMNKQKMLLFQQEIKNKRVAKIKSKLYHRIKKKQKLRAQLKEYENMDEEARLQQQQELLEERAKERIGMRHKTKSKHIQQMLKYGDKKTYQQSLNDINHQRQALLKKTQDIEVNSDDLDYDQLNDEEFKEQAIKDLQNELKGGDDDEQQEELTGIKFIDDLHNQKKNQHRDEARKIIAQLQDPDAFDKEILSEDDLIESDDEEGQKKKADKLNAKRKADQEILEKEEEFTGRKIYKKSEPEEKQTELEIEMEEMKQAKKKKRLNALDIVKDHIKSQKEQEENEQEIENEQSKSISQNGTNNKKQEISQQSTIQEKLKEASKKVAATTINEENLTDGLNVNKLKEKFKKNAQTEFSKKELEAFNIENKEEIYKDLSNFNVLVDDDNEQQFLAEKYEDYEKDLPQEKKPLQGWGHWVGQGIEQKNLPTAEELARQKAAKINLLKKQRADGSMDNVILNEKRNKLFTQHLVKELPHPYKNKEQFEYLHNAPIGSEWTTMRSHVNLIKPKIKTKAGNIIQPATAPKSFQQS
ncbi:Utp14p (macronuclear) [Tetrahymena thermophila SB210]|uniref:Utp14p n=1 Tax=Tetrahymena thermophila (strain SB210) TaxID=312017 RepID=Q22HC3_TETTS|nr:Utp14p [Tetrahymena thermophila SB210]EAR84778.1 Utp14p [Tetrahymena thermophila SB210]|eukprot:XP_001032441.1 Utp14p [Tetrahymena thermophila SB210]